MKVIELLMNMRDRGWLISKEHGPPFSPASNAELRRWCAKKSVQFDGKPFAAHDEVPDAECLVLFPKGLRITMPLHPSEGITIITEQRQVGLEDL